MSRWPGRLITKTPVTPGGAAPTASAPGIWTLPEVAYWNKQGLWPSASADPYWSYVSFLLGTTATNAAQNNTFLDSSTNNFTVTRNGNTTQGAFTPYGTLWSNYFDGSGDGLSISNYSSAALAFGTGDFTIEFWAFATTGPNNNWTPFFTMGTSGGGQEIRISQNVNGGGFGWLYPNNTNNGDVYAGYGAMTANTWHHIAMTRSGSTMRLFLDGTVIATGTGVSFNFTNTTILRIGLPQPAYADGAFTGYLSNLRIVKGTAVYTAAFTPPTAPLTAISGTGLLTCQANRLIDSSANNFTLTKNGDVAVSSFSPFILAPPGYSTAVNGGSGYFDGSGDYLTAPANAAFQVSGGDFTLETWFYMTALPAANASGSRAAGIFTYSSGFGGGYEFFVDLTNNVIQVSQPGGGNATYSSYTFSLNTWYHVAFSRASGTNRIFVNGVSLALVANAFPNNATGSPTLKIGAGLFSAGYEHYFPGYLVDARIVKGTGVYTSDFTLPTAPLTAITNTSLLLNFANAGIYDAAMKSDAETGGNAQASTTQVKYGTTSAYFDGNGDYLLTATSPVFTFGTGDFTVEAWVYLNAVTSTYTKGVVGTYAYVGAADRGWLLGVTSTGLTQLFMGGSSGSGFAVNGATTLTTGRWYHLAATRSGTTVRVFVDGVVDGSGTSAYNEDYTGRGLKVGTLEADSLSPSLGNPGASINGYIDDVRVTRGYARYTSNFTPPTAALPVY